MILSSTSIDQANFWQVVIPSLAYTSTPVKLGMLTLAGIHLHFYSESDVEQSMDALQVAEFYGTQFVEHSREQLQHLRSADADSNLVCSRLLSGLAFIFLRVHRRNGVTLADEEAWTWLRMLRGVNTVQIAIMKASRESDDVKIDPMLSNDMKPALLEDLDRRSRGGVQSNDGGHQSPLLELISNTQAERFNALHALISSYTLDLSHEQIADLHTSTVYLQELTAHVCSGEVQSIFRSVCTWPCRISDQVAEMLVGGSHVALAVFVHWLMLVVLIEDLWVSL